MTITESLSRLRQLDADVAEYVLGMRRVGSCALDIADCPGVYDPQGWARGPCCPPYSQDIEAAWIVHKHCCGWMFSKQRRYLAALRQRISDRVLRNPVLDIIGIEEVAHLMEPIDICRAALQVALEGKG